MKSVIALFKVFPLPRRVYRIIDAYFEDQVYRLSLGFIVFYSLVSTGFAMNRMEEEWLVHEELLGFVFGASLMLLFYYLLAFVIYKVSRRFWGNMSFVESLYMLSLALIFSAFAVLIVKFLEVQSMFEPNSILSPLGVFSLTWILRVLVLTQGLLFFNQRVLVSQSKVEGGENG